MKLKPRAWQRRFIDWMMRRGDGKPIGAYLHADLGTGKTLAALFLIERFRLPSDEFFVIAPKSAFPSWLDEAKKLGITLKPNVNLFTYEKFVRLEMLPVVSFIVLDEMHRTKSYRSQITKILWKYYRDVPKLGMTGTPADRVWELYTQYKLIDPAVWGDMSWTKWIERYFFVDMMHKPKRLIRDEYRDEIVGAGDKFTFRVTLDSVKMPEINVVDVRLAESRRVTKFWREYEKEIENPVSAFIREYAIAQGIDPETTEMFDAGKIDWALDFLVDNPRTLVFSYFRAPVEHVRAKHGDRFYYVLGDDKRDIDAILRHGDRPVFATYAIAEGINLQHHYDTIVYLSLPLAYRTYYQSRGRVYRSGQTRHVTVERLFRQPIDYEVRTIVERKMELDDYLRKRDIMQNTV